MAPGARAPRGPRSLPALGLSLVLLVAASMSAAAGNPGVSARAVEYPGAEGDMPARLYEPGGPRPLPGVLVLHTLAGPGPNVEAFAHDLAARGYVTLTPDLFSLHEFGSEGRTDHPLVLKNLEGALEFLAAQPGVDPDRLGAVGFSYGGRAAVLLAAARPARLRAVIVYYAIAAHAALGRPPSGRAATTPPLGAMVGPLRAAVLVHHGEADTNVPVEQGRLLHRALVAGGKSSTLHLYPAADHLFNFSIGPDVRHHPEAARLSWERSVRFLDAHLAGR